MLLTFPHLFQITLGATIHLKKKNNYVHVIIDNIHKTWLHFTQIMNTSFYKTQRHFTNTTISHLFHYLKRRSVFQNGVVHSERLWCLTFGATILMPHMIYIHHQYHLCHCFTYPFNELIFQDFALTILRLISFYDCSYIISITVVNPGQGINVTELFNQWGALDT